MKCFQGTCEDCGGEMTWNNVEDKVILAACILNFLASASTFAFLAWHLR